MKSKALKQAVIIILLIIFSLAGYSYGEIISADRRINWNPGIPGGIPNRTTICANVKNSPYNAVGNGVADDTTAINSAISACPSGQVVYIPEGTYKITGQISINKGIVLRGDGPSKTKLILTRTSGSEAKQYLYIGNSQKSSRVNVLSGYTKGSMSITLSDASGIAAGDYIMIDQLNDNTTTSVTNIGVGGACTWCNYDSSGTRVLGQILRVTGKSGNTVSLEQPLNWNYVSGASPQVKEITMTEYVGVENLYITQVGDLIGYLINISQCAYCWVKNIETYYAKRRHMEAIYSYRNEYRDSYFHHANNFGSDHGYGILLRNLTTNTLIENNIFHYLHLSVSLEAATGNVIAYNYSYDSQYRDNERLPGDLITHGAHPYFNLFEGNIVYRAQHDNYWGSTSHNTWFRNRLIGYKAPFIYDLRPVIVDADARYMNYVGNILGSTALNYPRYETENLTVSCYDVPDIYKLGYGQGSGDCNASGNDPAVKTTLLRHGNYDYYNNAVVWDSSITDQNIPNSLYLTSKPAFFGNLAWPPIGPDLNPMAGTIPAKELFDCKMAGGCGGLGGGGDTPPPSGGDSSSGDTSASGGGGCGFVREDNNGKGQDTKKEGVALMIMLIISLAGIAIVRRLSYKFNRNL